MYLLDTNVISQLSRRSRNEGVLRFFECASKNGHELYLSVLTLGEIQKGISKLERYGDKQQAADLQAWLNQLAADFETKIIPIDKDTSILWGALLATTDDTNAIDKLIAASALQYDLVLVTRNTDHIKDCGARYLNPFS